MKKVWAVATIDEKTEIIIKMHAFFISKTQAEKARKGMGYKIGEKVIAAPMPIFDSVDEWMNFTIKMEKYELN